MPNPHSDHVVEAIDAALGDYSVSADAMRHAPDAAPRHPNGTASQEAVDALSRALSSRAARIATGRLVEVPPSMAAEAGFSAPVALTRAAWEDCVAWGQDTESWPQDEEGRLWDVVWMTRAAIRRAGLASSGALVELYRVPRGGTEAELVHLAVHVGPGDSGEPVLTVSLPNEED